MNETVTMKDKVIAALREFGLPRLIITGFLVLLLIMAPFVGADLPTQVSNIINRFSWNGILVLAMVPMVHSGCGSSPGFSARRCPLSLALPAPSALSWPS